MIRQYTPHDRLRLRDFFVKLIEGHKEYISHGELQMGIASAPGMLAPDFGETWLRYLDRQTAAEDNTLLLAEEAGALVGFIMFGVTDDGGDSYGVIFDMGIDPAYRGRHLGKALIDEALAAFRERGVGACYLESGVNNHSAHAFFEKLGFETVSHIFRMPL